MPDPLRGASPAVVSREGRPLRPAAAPAGRGGKEERLQAACQEMESLFLQHLLGEMRKTIDRAGLFDGGRAEELYTSFLDAERARVMASSGGLGLSRLLYEQLAPRLSDRPSGPGSRGESD